MIREVVQNDEILKVNTAESPVDSVSQRIAADLCDTLRYLWSQGRICKSISANQIGENERIIAFADRLGGDIKVLFNPVITMVREEQEYWEDDASRPGKMFQTKKGSSLCVQYVGQTSRASKVNFYGESAMLIQQEVSNLNGITPEERCSEMIEVGFKKPNPKFLER